MRIEFAPRIGTRALRLAAVRAQGLGRPCILRCTTPQETWCAEGMPTRTATPSRALIPAPHTMFIPRTATRATDQTTMLFSGFGATTPPRGRGPHMSVRALMLGMPAQMAAQAARPILFNILQIISFEPRLMPQNGSYAHWVI